MWSKGLRDGKPRRYSALSRAWFARDRVRPVTTFLRQSYKLHPLFLKSVAIPNLIMQIGRYDGNAVQDIFGSISCEIVSRHSRNFTKQAHL